MKRNRAMDIIKFLACLIVFIDHFYLTFRSQMPTVVKMMKINPIKILVNGNLAVCMFLLISAYFLSGQVYRSESFEKLQRAVFKRYPRLMFPVAVLSCITYGMKKLDLFYNIKVAELMNYEWLQHYFGSKMTWKNLIKDTLFTVWYQKNGTFNGPFWMLHILFLGSFFVILLSVATAGKEKRRMWIFGIMAVTAVMYDMYLMCLVLGTFLAYLKVNTGFITTIQEKKWGIVLIGLLFLVGIMLPGDFTIPLKILEKLHIQNEYLNSRQFYNTIGAFFIVMAVECSNRKPQARIENPAIDKVTALSFAVYLVHWPIICSLSCYLYMQWYTNIENKLILFGSIFVITVLVVFIAAYIFHHIIEERICNKAVDKLCSWYFPKR